MNAVRLNCGEACSVCGRRRTCREGKEWTHTCKPKMPDGFIGPGTALKKRLQAYGIKPKQGCQCYKHAQQMDRKGIEWCKRNKRYIIKWLKREAKNRWNIAPPSFVLGRFVLQAIKDSERSLNHV